MPDTSSPSVESTVLTELAAVLRAIARDHRAAGPVLRDMARSYDARARGRAGRR